MKKIISIIAALAVFGGAAAVGVSAADITIIRCRNFENEEIAADNPRTVTVEGEIPETEEFAAYIGADDGGYRIVRTETE